MGSTTDIRQFLLQELYENPGGAMGAAARKFGISRQALSRHMQRLVAEGIVDADGMTRNRRYSLRTLRELRVESALAGLEEDRFWRSSLLPEMKGLPENALGIWTYGFTEMVNNAIDHSGGGRIVVVLKRTAAATEIAIHDDGIGIFRKIKDAYGLDDERHALLELAKGKLTTDPAHHTGEGIFFASRMFDRFAVLSGGVYFSHRIKEDEDWILEQDQERPGTSVFMELQHRTNRTTKEIFDRFASEEEDFAFTKTVVPVRLAKEGQEKLISRSQAKRLMARVDRFRTVILDFAEVDEIGQAFADEVFRVFRTEHPAMQVVPMNAGPAVQAMIRRAEAFVGFHQSQRTTP